MDKMPHSPKRGYIWIAVSSEAQMAEDKISLEEQEEVCRGWCERNKVQVCGVLKVPGLSRSESDVFDLFEEYASKGITAYADLRRLWKAKNFDYLVVYVLNRLGRSSSLYAYAMENTVRAGATVISVTEGIRIDDSNVELMLPMGSFASTSEIKNLKLRRKMGMKSRAERGLKQSSGTPFGFIEQRDERGKVTRMVPDPSLRRLLDDAAQLLIEGAPYLKMEIEAFERFGHGQDGKPYAPNTFYHVFFSPVTWGHIAQNHHRPSRPDGRSVGAWAYRPVPPPEGVTLYRDRVEPLYTGELAGRIMAELDRRTGLIGGARPRFTPWFSSLLVCDECGWYLVLNQGRNYPSGERGLRSYRCETIYRAAMRPDTPCSRQPYLKEADVRAHFEKVLSVMLASNDLGEFDPRRHTNYLDRRPAIQADIDRIDEEMKRLVKALRQTPLDNPAWALLSDSMTDLGEQRKRLENALRDAERNMAAYDVQDQMAALNEIRLLTAEGFWQLPTATINQLLTRVLGRYRFAVRGGKIERVVLAPVGNRTRANLSRVALD